MNLIREPAEAVLQLELLRLDKMATGVYGEAVSGDTAALASMIKIMELRARYLGLHKATKSETTVSGPDGLPLSNGPIPLDPPVLRITFTNDKTKQVEFSEIQVGAPRSAPPSPPTDNRT